MSTQNPHIYRHWRHASSQVKGVAIEAGQEQHVRLARIGTGNDGGSVFELIITQILQQQKTEPTRVGSIQE